MPIVVDAYTVTIELQIVVLLLLLVGVFFARGKKPGSNLIRHAVATTLAFGIHMTTVLIVMLPSFYANFLLVLSGFDIVSAVIVWIHIVTGIIAPILGFILIVSWRFRLPPNMNCTRRRKLMMPTFLIWTISLTTGIFVHLGII